MKVYIQTVRALFVVLPIWPRSRATAPPPFMSKTSDAAVPVPPQKPDFIKSHPSRPFGRPPGDCILHHYSAQTAPAATATSAQDTAAMVLAPPLAATAAAPLACSSDPSAVVGDMLPTITPASPPEGAGVFIEGIMSAMVSVDPGDGVWPSCSEWSWTGAGEVSCSTRPVSAALKKRKERGVQWVREDQ